MSVCTGVGFVGAFVASSSQMELILSLGLSKTTLHNKDLLIASCRRVRLRQE